MFLQVFHGLEIRIQPLFLRVRHEYDAVRSLQDELAAGLIEHLAGDGIKMEARLESADGPQVQWKEIEEQSAVRFRGEGHHFALLVLSGMVIDPLQVCGLTA